MNFMKLNLHKIIIVVVVFACLCFSSCEKEQVELEKNSNSWNATSQKISHTNVLNELNNATIKIYSLELKTNLKSQNQVFFEKIIRDNKYTTYTLPLNKFSVNEPYFKFFVIKKDGDNETAGIVKYIPARLSPVLNVNHFTGVIELFDIYGNLNAVSSFENSVVVSLRNTVYSRSCTNNIRLINHTCSNGGSHGVGQSCNNGLTNDAYYEIIITQNCTNSEPAHIAAPEIFMGSGGGSGGGGGLPTWSPEEILLNDFLNELTLEENNFIFSNMNVINYLLVNNVSEESKNFVLDIINLAKTDPNQADVNNLVNLSLKLESAGSNLFEDSFALTLDPYVDLDFTSLSTSPSTLQPNLFVLHTYMKYRLLRQTNTGWSRAKCAWEASKDIIHLSLDAFGLIPVGGEIADLANGVLYTIEGDGLNATLSYASAVPIVGWATAGTKFGIKIATTATGTTKFVWKVSNNIVQFGNRGQLRKVLHLAVGNPLVAHHIIPWGKSAHTVIQKAAKSENAFHMNEVFNGLAVAAWRNQPNHNAYDSLIKSKLDALPSNLTNDQAYSALTNILNQARQAIINNPNTHLNDLIF